MGLKLWQCGLQFFLAFEVITCSMLIMSERCTLLNRGSVGYNLFDDVGLAVILKGLKHNTVLVSLS